mmetsp:Transcript_115362/g.288290  ORF Transcript_115362/g.288290 Transcript_115362/m.288290 type:complete len:241 (-) Transcript_115362:260-982(-)|eukprot:CAMPEP_0115210180 /NCGR_PEP_ID=MMETSP0270-20121206/22113_1 /TAXON_ID=71861 /ORGANISM="Scrippsiella trochoidea, Strain CCMP3099" /LENGTH=240 /DNA_ID=CAMNT_0002623825 /DNA_START=83 /DNA_END=805 /DNA_ORIENTATION=-
MFEFGASDTLANLAERQERPTIYKLRCFSMDNLGMQQSNSQAPEFLPRLLGCSTKTADTDNLGRRERRCKTAPSSRFTVAEGVVLTEPDVVEGGCLPFGNIPGFGFSRWRRTKKSATVDFANKVITSSDNERRPRSILRKTKQDRRGDDSEEEEEARAVRRATSRVRFAPTVSVAKVSIVKIKDESPRRHKNRRAKFHDGVAKPEGVATSPKAALQQLSSEEDFDLPSADSDEAPVVLTL